MAMKYLVTVSVYPGIKIYARLREDMIRGRRSVRGHPRSRGMIATTIIEEVVVTEVDRVLTTEAVLVARGGTRATSTAMR
jgi:hypothetical protein